MKKITFLILILVFNLTYGSTSTKLTNSIDTIVIEITDNELEINNDGNLFYCDKKYAAPTKLIFPNLKSITNLNFCYTSNLVSIEFPNLEKIEGELAIYNNEDLIEPIFPKLAMTGDYVVMSENPLLSDVKLPELYYIGALFAFTDNPKLKHVETPKLKTVCERISFLLNPSLVEIDLPSLTNIGHCGTNEEHGGGFEFSSNELLSKINAPLLETAGDLNLYNNPKLESIETSNLVAIETVIHIHNNVNLKELKLQKLKSVGIDLHISSNDSLKTIDLRNLVEVGISFIIHANPLLEYLNLCSYEPPIIQYDENNIPIPSFPEFHLSNNPAVDHPPFCPDQKAEEEEDSDDDIREEEEEEEEPVRVSVHPNPAEDIVLIDSEIAFDKVEIYDLSGNLIKSFRPNESGYDVSDVAAGMYVMIIYHKDSIYGTIKKLVIR
ncbi:T9SS type A sorting domain-containing protein [Flagellimonas flava]|uniref:T9SS type A sorting domain-containing protein n=1 Tax=Flagellimonas flava TaxID=570519 RepID=UPI003D6519FC